MEEKLILKEHPVCCGVKMSLEELQCLNLEERGNRYICFTCGTYINIVIAQLDEEDLENEQVSEGLKRKGVLK